MSLISDSPFELSGNKLAMKQGFYSKKKKKREKAIIEIKIKATVDASISSQ